MNLRPRHLLTALSTLVLVAACANGGGDALSNDDDSGFGGSDPANDDDTGASTGGASSSSSQASTSASTGGGATTTSSSSVGGAGGSGTTVTASSASTGGSNPGACAHDVCTNGVALDYGCDSDQCVMDVCDYDNWCCTVEWDDLCIQEADDLCGAMCNPVGTVDAGDLVITEIMNNPDQVFDDAGEWFELYNVSTKTLDLQGLVIAHHYNDPTKLHVIADSVMLAPGDFAVLGNNGDSLTNGGVIVDYAYPSTEVFMGNGKDYLAIQTDDVLPTIIDATEWDEAVLDPKGASRTLNPSFMSANDNDDDANFCEASSTYGAGDLGTPGAANDQCI